MKKSTKIGISILILIGILLNYYTYTIHKFLQQEETYCGIVEVKSSEEVNIKYGTKTELYIMVNFDKLGLKEIRPSKETYHSISKGQRICFDLESPEVIEFENSYKHFLFNLCGLFALLFDFVLLILIIIAIGSLISFIGELIDK